MAPTICAGFSIIYPPHLLFVLSSEALKLPLCLADLPTSDGTSQYVETFPLSQLPSRGTGPILISFSLSLSFFFSSCPTQLRGDFLVLLEV